jgi:hypothetical protein
MSWQRALFKQQTNMCYTQNHHYYQNQTEPKIAIFMNKILEKTVSDFQNHTMLSKSVKDSYGQFIYSAKTYPSMSWPSSSGLRGQRSQEDLSYHFRIVFINEIFSWDVHLCIKGIHLKIILMKCKIFPNGENWW